VTSPLILIASGGTGGHMFPARAFADAIVARGGRVALITDPRGKRYTEGFPAEEILILPVTNASEGGIKGKIDAGFAVMKSLGQVGPFIKDHKPDAIVGFGGYPTFPVLFSAGKIPIFIHEQNAVLGRVNKLFQGKAVKIASGFAQLDGLEHPDKHVVAGNPVRQAIVDARLDGYPDLSSGSLRILVTGGSQGARILGDIVPQSIAALPEDLRLRLFVSHQVREEQAEQAREVYADAGVQAEVWPFFKDMADRLARCHLVIGRSGASTVSETAVVGRPAILVPLAIATNDHQTFNAQALAASGAAEVISEADFSLDRLTGSLRNLLTAPDELQKRAKAARTVGKPDAAETLADLVFGAIGGALQTRLS
jgi:UDP-N-acetylglucosamine--N-acetylmuramyl-(pentapeptide) pyrophosphoryl-undecaprenol N-acetylglucosamine transferase